MLVVSHPDFFRVTAELPRHNPAPERTGYAGPVWFPCYHTPKVPAVEPEFLGTLVLKSHDRKGGFENSVKNINKW